MSLIVLLIVLASRFIILYAALNKTTDFEVTPLFTEPGCPGGSSRVESFCKSRYTVSVSCNYPNGAPFTNAITCAIGEYCIDWDGNIPRAACFTASEVNMFSVPHSTNKVCNSFTRYTTSAGKIFVTGNAFNNANRDPAVMASATIGNNAGTVLVTQKYAYHIQYSLSEYYPIDAAVTLIYCIVNSQGSETIDFISTIIPDNSQ